MKNWLKTNKWAIILSTLGTLLPIIVGLLLWDQLPDTMTTHWGADGIADGTSGKWVAVFLLPLILTGVDLLCILVTAIDPKQAEQNKKSMGVIFWIMPCISMFASCSIYFAAMGKTLQVATLLPLLMGVMFIFIGNYLPKAKQNSYYGVKLPWTLRNEENWNKTHRLSGKVWVVGGLLLLPTVLLPLKWMVTVFIFMLFAMILIPTLYSYSIYRAHKAKGIRYDVPPQTKGAKAAKVISLVGVVAVLVFTAVLMLTGDIAYALEDDMLRIDATYDQGMTLSYDAIDNIELRTDFDFGHRIFGFGSAKLSMGRFSSDELIEYTLYAYNSNKTVVLIQAEGKWLAINARSAEKTEALYRNLLEKTAK